LPTQKIIPWPVIRQLVQGLSDIRIGNPPVQKEVFVDDDKPFPTISLFTIVPANHDYTSLLCAAPLQQTSPWLNN
jgi:hypothetical protein